jgi:DNA-binding transcriptional LysR family regulator
LHEHDPRLVTADLMTIREAVLDGLGIAALPEMMYGNALRAGQLSPVMPGWTLPVPQLYAVFVSRQGMPPAVRAFVDYLVEKLDHGDYKQPSCPERDKKEAAAVDASST